MKLKNLKPRLATLDTSKVRPLQNPRTSRARKQDGRGSPYDRRDWRDRISPDKLRESPLCEHCKREGRLTPATQVDHIDGDPENNAPANLASLCAPCHSLKTARENGGFGLQPTKGTR